MGFLKRILGKSDDSAAEPANPESLLSLHDAQELLAQSENPSAEFRTRQREKFVMKFGREPVPGKDPLFFDPDAAEPIQITAERLKAIVMSKLAAARAEAGGIPSPSREDKEAIADAVAKAREEGNSNEK